MAGKDKEWLPIRRKNIREAVIWEAIQCPLLTLSSLFAFDTLPSEFCTEQKKSNIKV